MRPTFLIAAAIALLSTTIVALETPPPPTQWVTDRAGILSASDADRLNTKLREFEARTGTQFIVYTLPSLEGESLEDFSNRAAETWRVGQAKFDDGLVLFVFSKDRKLRVEVGYGLEEKVTDAYASRVVRQTIVPHFQRGNFVGGIDAGVDQLIARVEGKESPAATEALVRPNGGASEPTSSFGEKAFGLLLFFFILIIVLSARSRRGCLPFIFPGGSGGITFGGGGFSGGGGGFGGFSGGGGSFGGGGASGSW